MPSIEWPELCKDCVHCFGERDVHGNVLEYAKPICELSFTSPVTGDLISGFTCLESRSSEVYCGVKAKYFMWRRPDVKSK